jgi:hypothetical protein
MPTAEPGGVVADAVAGERWCGDRVEDGFDGLVELADLGVERALTAGDAHRRPFGAAGRGEWIAGPVAPSSWLVRGGTHGRAGGQDREQAWSLRRLFGHDPPDRLCHNEGVRIARSTDQIKDTRRVEPLSKSDHTRRTPTHARSQTTRPHEHSSLPLGNLRIGHYALVTNSPMPPARVRPTPESSSGPARFRLGI